MIVTPKNFNEKLLDLLIYWFKNYRVYNNYVNGRKVLTLDGSWDFF